MKRSRGERRGFPARGGQRLPDVVLRGSGGVAVPDRPEWAPLGRADHRHFARSAGLGLLVVPSAAGGSAREIEVGHLGGWLLRPVNGWRSALVRCRVFLPAAVTKTCSSLIRVAPS